MTITRIINGEEVLIELTTKEMSEAYGIIHRKELLEFVDFKLKEERTDIFEDEEMRKEFEADYISEWLNYDSTDDEDVFQITLESF